MQAISLGLMFVMLMAPAVQAGGSSARHHAASTQKASIRPSPLHHLLAPVLSLMCRPLVLAAWQRGGGRWLPFPAWCVMTCTCCAHAYATVCACLGYCMPAGPADPDPDADTPASPAWPGGPVAVSGQRTAACAQQCSMLGLATILAAAMHGTCTHKVIPYTPHPQVAGPGCLAARRRRLAVSLSNLVRAAA